MKLTDAIKQALVKKRGEQPTAETAVPDQIKPAGPKRTATTANKPARKSAGRGR